MTTPFKLRSGSSPFKQDLSPAAARRKKRRDIRAAKKAKRKARKAENQRIGQTSTHDLHHKPDGTVVKMSIANNRDVWQHGERTA
jgi:hypothetical protein